MTKSEKESVAFSSAAASAALTVMKFVVGFMTGSLGIISEAAHSALDFGAALLTFFAVRASDKPADERHQYGHAKVESVSAFVETALLFLTSAWIIYESVRRLIKPSAVEVTWYAIAVIIVSIIVDLSRSKALKRTADKTGSQALEADALHFSSDVWSSAVVLAGLIFVALGVNGADAVAALGVAVFVIFAGIRLAGRSIHVLIDAAPEGVTEKISRLAKSVEGVVGVSKIRVRPAGVSFFIDMELVISRKLPFERVQEIVGLVKESIRQEHPEADLTVSARPVALDSETISERIRILADRRGVPVHDVAVHSKIGKKSISFDLEVDEGLSIGEAHKIASSLERDIKKELGTDIVVNTHIEPVPPRLVQSNEAGQEEIKEISGIFRELRRGFSAIRDMHGIQVEKIGAEYFVTLHCVFNADVSSAEAHEVSTRIEYLAKLKRPDIRKVVVHSEPR